MSVPITRYFGIGKEAVYKTKVLPVFHNDITSGGMDSPADPFIHYEGGLGRYPRRAIAGAYRSEGSVEMAADISTLWFFLWLVLGVKATTDDTGVTPIADEVLGSTDADGALSDTLIHTPVCLKTAVVYNATPLPVAQDDGGGFMRKLVQIADEAHPTGAGVTTLAFTLSHPRVTPGTFEFYDAIPTLVASDNGAGLIVEEGSSGVLGTIDYVNGLITLAGLTASTAYTANYTYMDVTIKRGTLNYLTGAISLNGLGASEAHTINYSYGKYVHVITATNEMDMLSATVRIGKDLYEHTFTGVAISQLTLAIERELADLSLELTGGEDLKDTIQDEDNLFIPQEFPIPFHHVAFGWSDYGVTPSDASCDVDSIELAINNNADGEGGLGLNSRYPHKIYAGNLDITIDLTLKFETTEAKEDFWGSAAGPTETPTKKAAQLTLDASDWGSIVFDMPKCFITSVAHVPSGHARLTQPISLKAQYDTITESLITVTATCLADHK